MLVRDVHRSNAPTPMLVRLFGSVMLVRKLHPQNASIPMVVR